VLSRHICCYSKFGSLHQSQKFWDCINRPPAAQTVYVTPCGTYYHKGNCRTVENISNEMNLMVTVKKGYKPHSLYSPPIVR
jgi:hypothetical protein